MALSKNRDQRLEELIAQHDFGRLLEIKLQNMFPNLESRAGVIRILSSYDDERPEAPRVRLAVLKLSGADLAEIREKVERAIEDYEDAIGWAESPHQMKCSMQNRKLRNTDREQLVAEDRGEFQNWLRQQ